MHKGNENAQVDIDLSNLEHNQSLNDSTSLHEFPLLNNYFTR